MCLGPAAVLAAGAWAFTSGIPERHIATTAVVVREDLDEVQTRSVVGVAQSGRPAEEDFPLPLSDGPALDRVARATAATLGLTAEEVLDSVSVVDSASQPRTFREADRLRPRRLLFRAASTRPEVAGRLAAEFADEYVKVVPTLLDDRVGQARAGVLGRVRRAATGTEALRLREQLSLLRTVHALERRRLVAGASEPVATRVVRPRPARNAAVAGAIGLLLGMLVVRYRRS